MTTLTQEAVNAQISKLNEVKNKTISILEQEVVNQQAMIFALNDANQSLAKKNEELNAELEQMKPTPASPPTIEHKAN